MASTITGGLKLTDQNGRIRVFCHRENYCCAAFFSHCDIMSHGDGDGDGDGDWD